jgi:hypothetical protein
MRRRPAELGPGLGRGSALIEQQDFGERVAWARPSLIIRTGHRSRSADGDRGRLRSSARVAGSERPRLFKSRGMLLY